jgi:hypothetical protein
MMMLVATNMPTQLPGLLVVEFGGFDKDVWNAISRMAVPQGGAGSGH